VIGMTDTPDAAVPQPTPVAPAPLPAENRTRGTLLALLIIPAGIIVWVIVAAIGFISGWVGIGVAVGALALYRLGSGGRISMNGALRVSVIVVLTIVAAFIAGVVAADPNYFSRALQAGKFVEGLGATIARGGGDTLISVLLVVAFLVIGVVLIFRTAATQAKEQQAAATLLPPAN
jgi:hypothetical protein